MSLGESVSKRYLFLKHNSLLRLFILAAIPACFGAFASASQAVIISNGGFVPSVNLISGPDSATAAGINVGGTGDTKQSIYTIPSWQVVDNPNNVSGWVNNLMYVVSDGNTFSKEGNGLNPLRQNNRNNWAMYSTPGQTITAPGGSGWYIASDGDPLFSGAIQQVLTGLQPGKTYDVEFYQAGGQFDCIVSSPGNCGSSQYFGATTRYWQVTFGTNSQSSSTISLASQAPVSAWEKQKLSFLANNTTEILNFLAYGTPSNQPPMALLSGVTVTPQGGTPPNPNPVPAPLGLAGVGAALGFCGRLQRQSRRLRNCRTDQ